MTGPATSAVRLLRRFAVPASLSVLLHVFAVLQAAPALPGEPAPPAPLDVYLSPSPDRDRAPAAEHTDPVRPSDAIPIGRPAREQHPPTTTRARVGPAPTAATERVDPVGGDPGGPIELVLPPAPVASEPAGPPAPDPRLRDSAPPPDPDPAIAPLYHQPPGQERSGKMPPPAAPGVGFSFDFWSPPVFEEEMARAAEAIGRAEAEHQRVKTTDLGHGVICNTGRGWFVCADDDIERCNTDHDGSCRYARPEERYQLEIDYVF